MSCGDRKTVFERPTAQVYNFRYKEEENSDGNIATNRRSNIKPKRKNTNNKIVW